MPKRASTSDAVTTGKWIVGQIATHTTPGLHAKLDPDRQ
jgi:hypothetical protein